MAFGGDVPKNKPPHQFTLQQLQNYMGKQLPRHVNSPSRQDMERLIGQGLSQVPQMPEKQGTPIGPNVFSQDHEDQIKREKIPTIADVPTLYRPRKNMLMVVPLPEMEMFGGIIIPSGMRLAMNEGHVIAVGPDVPADIGVGDCVTWEENTGNKIEVDGIPFLLVSEAVCIMSIPHEELEKAALEREQRKLNLGVVPPAKGEPEAHNSGH